MDIIAPVSGHEVTVDHLRVKVTSSIITVGVPGHAREGVKKD